MPGLASVRGEAVERAVRRRIDHEIADEPRRMTRHRDRHRRLRHPARWRSAPPVPLDACPARRPTDPPAPPARPARPIRAASSAPPRRRRRVSPFCFASVSKKRDEKKWQWASFSMSSRQCAGPDGPTEPVDVGAGGRALTTLRRFDENSGASLMQVPRMPIDVSNAFMPDALQLDAFVARHPDSRWRRGLTLSQLRNRRPQSLRSTFSHHALAPCTGYQKLS